ncbi:MAG TPA: hypothetical protein EYP56_16815 [Planctomycetaceae bacterium]|nr:hypothetical protein [Planctomycetaceae bacterium]
MESRQSIIVAAPFTVAASCLWAQEPVRIGQLEVPDDSPLARGEHPRLMITRAQRPAIRARLAHPEIQTYLKQARELVEIDKADALLLATMYQLTGNTEYAELAKSKLEGPSWDPAWTFAFDLLADTMSTSECRKMASQILEHIKANRWRPRLLLCLAAWGHGLDEELGPLIQATYEEEIVRRIAYNDRWTQGRGGSSMGHGYHGEHFFSAEYATALGWSNATGEDVLGRADFDDQQPAWYVYHYLPWETVRQVIRVGVTMSPFHVQALTPRKHQGESYVMRTITDTRNGLGQWWQREFIGNWPQPRWRAGQEHMYGLVGRLVWLDPAIPSVPPQQFPETRLFPENGHVVMRSDWTEDATIALFRCGRFGEIDGYGGRNNLDNLHFIIFRRGYLAPDTGCVHSVNEKVWQMAAPSNVHNYGKQTIAHNAITVGRRRYEVRGHNNRVLAYSLRGGQVAVQKRAWYKAWGLTPPKAVKVSASFKEGEITAYRTSPACDYACGDATHSYPPERVRRITRQFLYLKPDLFVIFDRVLPSDPGLEVIWNLHAYQRPAWNGKTEPEATQEGHFLHTGGDTFTITNRAGAAMEVRTLLPEAGNRIVRTIGGVWHDFEVDGVNYGPTAATYELLERRKGDGGLEGVGGWRIEITPGKANGEVYFLHVLRVVEPGGGRKAPLETTPLTARGRAGVRIRSGDRETEVLFNTVGQTGGTLVLNGHAENLATRIEDHYDRWSDDPRYQQWISSQFMGPVVFPYGRKSHR